MYSQRLSHAGKLNNTIIIIIIIIISKTMFMVLSAWQIHCESSPGSFDESRTAPTGRRPKTKPYDLGCESACTGCQNLHPPSPSPNDSKVCAMSDFFQFPVQMCQKQLTIQPNLLSFANGRHPFIWYQFQWCRMTLNDYSRPEMHNFTRTVCFSQPTVYVSYLACNKHLLYYVHSPAPFTKSVTTAVISKNGIRR